MSETKISSKMEIKLLKNQEQLEKAYIVILFQICFNIFLKNIKYVYFSYCVYRVGKEKEI